MTRPLSRDAKGEHVFERMGSRGLELLALAVATAALGVAIRSGSVDLDRASFGATRSAWSSAPPSSTPADDRVRVPVRWKAALDRFAADDSAKPTATGGVVFVGSSSIDYWPDLPSQFPAQHVVQRGLPGATMADCLEHVDRLVLPRRPRTVVVYAGDNDLANGVAPERIVDDFVALANRVWQDLPATRIVFVSIKPSPARFALLDRVRRTNTIAAARARSDPRLDFVDVFTPMLDGDAQVRRDLFVGDGLHMNALGYALWRDAIGAHLY